MNSSIPKSHPRYVSLLTREKIALGLKKGFVHETGLIAHGRGEAFDYLLGETTIPVVNEAERIAAAALVTACHPVISVNGNVVALAAEECIRLSHEIPAPLEVNLFHRTTERVKRLVTYLKNQGAQNVLGLEADAVIAGLDHDRARCDHAGIFSADVVLVPLEDGDRCQALVDMGKTVIAVDLNPFSRTAQTASITIVDNLLRAMPSLLQYVQEFKAKPHDELYLLVDSWNNRDMLKQVYTYLSKRLNSLS